MVPGGSPFRISPIRRAAFSLTVTLSLIFDLCAAILLASALLDS
jgi:hypothetical protein